MDLIASATADALLGTVLDEKYRLESRLGSGGFGTVYRATHLGLGQAVAVKILKANISNATSGDLARFRQEGASACRIKHPNAVTIYDFGITASGYAYLVMELLEGHSLATELRVERILSPMRCAEILVPVCDVLAEAHAEGIIHRDIKPDNIFLHRTKRGEVVKVVDFGIAKLVDNAATVGGKHLTATGEVIGTLSYMAPERLRNKPYDGRADAYSLGIMLYEMLGGRVPFEPTESGDMVSVIFMQVNDDPPPLRELNADVPPEVEAVVLRALSKNPEERLSVQELAQGFAQAAGVQIQSSSSAIIPTVPSVVFFSGANISQMETKAVREMKTPEAPTRLYEKGPPPQTGETSPETEVVQNAPPVGTVKATKPAITSVPEAFVTRPITNKVPSPQSKAHSLDPVTQSSTLHPQQASWRSYLIGGAAVLILGGAVWGGVALKNQLAPPPPGPPAATPVPPPPPPPNDTPSGSTADPSLNGSPADKLPAQSPPPNPPGQGPGAEKRRFPDPAGNPPPPDPMGRPPQDGGMHQGQPNGHPYPGNPPPAGHDPKMDQRYREEMHQAEIERKERMREEMRLREMERRKQQTQRRRRF